MTVYILILAFYRTGFVTAEFNDLKACQHAIEATTKIKLVSGEKILVPQLEGGTTVEVAVCVPKSSDKLE